MSERSLPFRGRQDLVIAQIAYLGVEYSIIKDPVELKYFRLQPQQFAIFQALNGINGLRHVRDIVQRKFPAQDFTLSAVQAMVIDLVGKGLVTSTRIGLADVYVRRGKQEMRDALTSPLKNPLYIKLPGWDPDRFLSLVYPPLRHIFHRFATIGFLTFILGSLLYLLSRYETVLSRLPEFSQFFGWPNLLWLWVTFAVAKAVHELGHGLSCRHFGGECHEMGVMLILFSPTLYCDVSDSWLFNSKWQRVAVGLGGIYFEMILSSFALLLWWNAEPGLLQHLALSLFFVSATTTVLFNANPLLRRFDGYYILSDLLEIPNLRSKSQAVVNELIARIYLGEQIQTDPFVPAKRLYLLVYGICSAAYRVVLAILITGFLYNLLKPYRLESLGFLLAVLYLGRMMTKKANQITKAVRRASKDRRKRWRLTVTSLSSIAALGLACFIPIPWSLQLPFYVEPEGLEDVYTVNAGTLTEVFVKPGMTVSAGTPLLKQSDPELQHERMRLERLVEEARTLVRTHAATGDAASLAIARQEVEAIERQLRDCRLRCEQLVITAPQAGLIIEAPQTERVHDQQVLGNFYGDPLDLSNIGAHLPKATYVCAIASPERARAIAILDQTRRNYVDKGTPVRLRFEHAPETEIPAKVAGLSRAASFEVPRLLSIKHGGTVPTVTDPARSVERSADAVVMLVIPLDHTNARTVFTTGMRGHARIRVYGSGLASWAWKLVRETFHFQL
ncbi:hypothetical protein [Roseiconus lacunae]|uniref:hypothetical protein n=1 Tax=Roseiconus lacunae TaxID=2605694 RepID=UPI001E51AC07|nr:hypothetical protein [Roseiconus lacunae]MCD0458691.1 hypothetical protein [Roseiconus lacunae]